MPNLRSIAGRSRARHALVVAALALFGLLAMHGWGTHPGAHSGMHAAMSHSPTHVKLVHGDDHASVPAHPHRGQLAGEAAAVHADAVSCDDGCGGSDGMGLLGLCLAVLGGVVLAFVLLLLLRRIPLPRAMLPTFQDPVPVGRERDPPGLHRLCVIRC